MFPDPTGMRLTLPPCRLRTFGFFNRQVDAEPNELSADLVKACRDGVVVCIGVGGGHRPATTVIGGIVILAAVLIQARDPLIAPAQRPGRCLPTLRA